MFYHYNMDWEGFSNDMFDIALEFNHDMFDIAREMNLRNEVATICLTLLTSGII